MDRVEDKRWSGKGRGRYSSLGRKKVHVRKWKYSRPHKGYGWFAGKNAWHSSLGLPGWQIPQPKTVLAKIRELGFKTKIFSLILLVTVSFTLGVLGIGYSVPPPSHFVPGPCVGELRAAGAPCQDPTQLIWQRQSGEPSSLNDFNLSPGGNQIYCTNCNTFPFDALQEKAASNNASVAITKNPIGDLSLAASKTLAFVTGYGWEGEGFSTSSSSGTANHWGFFLTTNNTAPAHDIGSSSIYNPRHDPNVLMVVDVFCGFTNGGACGQALSGPTYLTNLYLLKHPGTGETINSEDTGGCGSGGSCLNGLGPDASPSNCLGPSCTGGSTGMRFYNALGTYLNYTGSTNTSSCTVSSNAYLGTGCSWLFNLNDNQTTVSFGTGTIGNDVIPPYTFFAASPVYLGIYDAIPSIAVDWNLSGPNIRSALGSSITSSIDSFIFVPSPTGATVNSNLDSGGFLGSAFNHYINGWNQICSALSINSFCAGVYTSAGQLAGSLGTEVLNGLLAAGSAILSALSFFETIVASILNVVGSAFGFPTLGTTIFTFINSLITVFTTAVPNAFAQIANIFNGWLNALTIVFTTGIIGQIFSYLSSILTFGVNIAVFAFGVFTTGLSWTTIFVPFWMFIWFFGFNADEGMDGWIRWFDFAKWLAFDIGVKTVTLVINWTIDVTTALMALLPKPFVQIAGRFPRVPILEIHGSFSTPSFDGRALREGNLFSVLGMLGGFIGFVWYELTQSSIPGTLANEFTGQPFIQGATTAIVFYKLFLPMAVLTVFLLMIPTLFTSIFGVIVPGPSVAFPTLGSRPRRGVSIQGGRGPLIRQRVPGKRSSAFIKGRLEKIEGREKESKRLRNEREEEARNKVAEEKQRQQEESVRRNEQAKKQAQEKERQRQEKSVSSDEAMFGQ